MKMLEKVSENCYRIARRGAMKAEVLVYLNRKLYAEFSEDASLQQLIDAASLPGVVSPVVGMPDIHSGFGLPIGGVMAMDAEQGLVSSGAVGMDINCGVRLLRTNIRAEELSNDNLTALIRAIGLRVPSGIGTKSKHAALIKDHFKDFLLKGVPFLVELGYGRKSDPEAIEDGGALKGAALNSLSSKAIERGLQLSTIGGGNHFVELGLVEKIFDPDAAEAYGLREGTLSVLIHTGSRGFGHQICTDYSAEMKKAAAKYKIEIPSAGLAAVPIKSGEGKRYLAAMTCAINFAFCNRQWITDDIRQAFRQVFGGSDEDYDLGLVYDVAHNTAKFEEIGGRRLLIHRKGATRALPPGNPLNPQLYKDYGHPVLIPGSMGTASYVIRAEKGVEQIYNSVNHGAGRVLSRTAARKQISVEALKEKLGRVIVSGRSYKAYLDEAPQAYKNIDQVVETLVQIGFSSKVARLNPLAVLKGEGND
ncbi:MAG: RtcB family protein [Firmicutes bacterium]|nr:RtcB family protein [Bacillota bacterium]